jgi:hypothetical protein
MIENQKFDEFINSDDALFHYTSMEKGIENIFVTKKLWLTTPQKTDDPQEYNDWMISLVGWSLPDDITQSWAKATQLINQKIKKKAFISCFCMNSTIEISEPYTNDKSIVPQLGYLRSRMWSQYGDHHRGLCLVFSKSEIEKIIEGMEQIAKAKNVEYSNEIDHSALVLDGNMLDDSGVNASAIIHIQKSFDNIFFTKNIDYRDEAEFRIVVLDETETNEHKEISTDLVLKGVILGDRFPKIYYPTIKSIGEIEVRQLRWLNGKFIPLNI